VVRLAGDALDRSRRRVQQDLRGHRGFRNDPLYRARRTLHTGQDLLIDRQRALLVALFAADGRTFLASLGIELTLEIVSVISDQPSLPATLACQAGNTVRRTAPPSPRRSSGARGSRSALN
jgi:hypothetical protein